MKNLFICYPKCSTCQKAEKWLKENQIEYEKRNIVEENPNKKEIENWVKQSGKEIKKILQHQWIKI